MVVAVKIYLRVYHHLFAFSNRLVLLLASATRDGISIYIMTI
jgi:hypothetical protein